MIASRDSLVLLQKSGLDDRASSKAPDLQDLYRDVLAQMMGNIEQLVAQAFLAHTTRHGLSLPAAIADALEPTRTTAESANLQLRPDTGNAGLDFLNEQLVKSAPGLVPQGGVPTPLWLEPFTLPERVRFTRTPDPVMRWERSAPTAEELSLAARQAAAEAARHAIAEGQGTRIPADEADADLPVWRRPFTLPPNVRYTRTPDPKQRLAVPLHPAESDGAATPHNFEHDLPSQDLFPLHALAGGFSAAGTVFDVDETSELALGNSDLLSLSTTFSQSFTGKPPSWLANVPARASTPAKAASVSAPRPSAGPTAQIRVVDADCEGSAALGKTASLIEADENVGTSSYAADVEPADTPKFFSVEAIAETGSASLTVSPGRRAFGSHGMPGFENALHFASDPDAYQYPDCELLVLGQKHSGPAMSREALEQNARLLEGVLEDFGIRGEIIAVRPGPVVTLYEFEPAPGVKSSRVMNLADDIARSMSAVSARVAVVQGRNVIGIELPNERRETVFLRELIGSTEFGDSSHRLAIALGKTIGGESVIVDLARMPHLLVAGTTGSGKSVAINTMILSLLYRLRPEECRLIMVDPKMLELSIYDGIPHLLTPVVTDSKKAVIALKWAVREMEDRYKKMAKVGVRNIDGFNARVTDAKAKGEVITRTIQQGFDRETGEAAFETEEMDLATLPYIVIIVDEMADLMMVAGKEIEGAIQRLAQMARAAGIHLIMATQRPSVDVITGTIKANFPTRISFQVTSKIDSRTILGEQGAEQLLGQGDMLHMAGGGRIVRVHGPFVSDGEVEKVVWHLKAQGHPDYLDVVTADDDDVLPDDEAPTSDGAVFDRGSFGDETADLYDQAVKIVFRDKKCSTSYIQRRLQVGYNKAASIVERMEKEGLVGPASQTGKREILNYSRDHSRVIMMPGEDD